MPSDGTQFDFALVKYQDTTGNNPYSIVRTEGDRRYSLRYHSGRNNRPATPSDNGFDNILFEYREWYWIPVSSTSLWSLYGDPNYGGGAQGNNFYYMPSSTLGSGAVSYTHLTLPTIE